MPIRANTFVWVNETSPGAQPEKITTDEPLADDFANTEPKELSEEEIVEEEVANGEFIPLSDNGTFAVKRSQYTEDMMTPEEANNINTETDNKKE